MDVYVVMGKIESCGGLEYSEPVFYGVYSSKREAIKKADMSNESYEPMAITVTLSVLKVEIQKKASENSYYGEHYSAPEYKIEVYSKRHTDGHKREDY